MKPYFVLFAIFISQITVSAQVFDTISYYKKYPEKDLHEDVDFLLKKFEIIHPNYFKETSKDSVLKRYSDLKSQITKPLTKLDFLNLTAPVAFNIIKDGHNFVNGGTEEETKMYVERAGKFFPYPILMENRRLFVNSKKTDLPFRAEIIKINEVSSKTVIEKILDMYNAESNEFEETFMSAWFSSSYWTSFGGFRNYTIEYILPGEQTAKKIVVEGKSTSQIAALRPASNKKNYSFYELPEIQAGVLEFNACDDLKNFRPFCDSIFTLINNKEYKNLIIDIRENIGGTTRLNDVLLEYLTDKPVSQFDLIETKVSRDKKRNFVYWNNHYAGWFKWYHYLYYPIYIRQNAARRRIITAKNGTLIKKEFVAKKPISNSLTFKGDIFLLTSRKTYSAAACLAAACKQYKIATLIGKETGELTSFTAEWVPVELPHTKLVFAISSQRFMLAGGTLDGKGVIPDYITENKLTNKEASDLDLDCVKKIIQNKITGNE